MDDLDFSTLTDDQLLALARLALAECVHRGAAIAVAAQSVYLDAAEQSRIAEEAAQREAAKLRAQERERIAKEAAEAVRRKAEEEKTAGERLRQAAKAKEDAIEAEKRREAAAEAGRVAAQKMRLREQRERDWLRRAATALGVEPKAIDLLLVDTNYGRRVLINDTGKDRYARDHWADWTVGSSRVKTKQEFVSRKPELIAFCAEFAASYPSGELYLEGCSYTWEESCPTN